VYISLLNSCIIVIQNFACTAEMSTTVGGIVFLTRPVDWYVWFFFTAVSIVVFCCYCLLWCCHWWRFWLVQCRMERILHRFLQIHFEKITVALPKTQIG